MSCSQSSAPVAGSVSCSLYDSGRRLRPGDAQHERPAAAGTATVTATVSPMFGVADPDPRGTSASFP